MNAPTTHAETAAPLTPQQQQAQAVIDANDMTTMLRESVATLRMELAAAEYMQAEHNKTRDVQQRKKKFMRLVANTSGILPEFSDCALRLIQQGK